MFEFAKFLRGSDFSEFLVCVCVCVSGWVGVLFIYTIFSSIIRVLQEELNLFTSAQQIYDFFK